MGSGDKKMVALLAAIFVLSVLLLSVGQSNSNRRYANVLMNDLKKGRFDQAFGRFDNEFVKPEQLEVVREITVDIFDKMKVGKDFLCVPEAGGDGYNFGGKYGTGIVGAYYCIYESGAHYIKVKTVLKKPYFFKKPVVIGFHIDSTAMFDEVSNDEALKVEKFVNEFSKTAFGGDSEELREYLHENFFEEEMYKQTLESINMINEYGILGKKYTSFDVIGCNLEETKCGSAVYLAAFDYGVDGNDGRMQYKILKEKSENKLAIIEFLYFLSVTVDQN